jgi:hypothetical protein
MEVVAILGLIGTCGSVAKVILDASSGLNHIIGSLQNANKNIIHLAAQLDLFSATVEELHTWLKQKPQLAPSLERTIRSSLSACQIIVSDIEEHVRSISPATDQGNASLVKKIKVLWKEDTMKEHERMLSTQFQAFSLIIGLKAL